MMEDNPRDHKLNEVLARVAGLHWAYCPEINEHGYFDADGNCRYPERTWDPLHDANQMWLGKIGLRKMGYNYSISAISGVPLAAGQPGDVSPAEFSAHIWNIKDVGFLGSHNESELMAFALAVYAMEQERIVNEQEV